MSLPDLLAQLPLPLVGEEAAHDALTVAMELEDEFDITLADDELTPEALGDADRVIAVLRGHGLAL